MLVSVIIPTYNRKESLLRLLSTLGKQTILPTEYEVVVVDDGSDYAASEITERVFPYALRYIRQQNSGATAARNHGVHESRGDVLVFIDDDLTVSEQVLEILAQGCLSQQRALAMGSLFSRSEDLSSPYTRYAIAQADTYQVANPSTPECAEVHFSFCNTQLLAVRRSDFLHLGMLQDPTGGWPNWDDVDFGYRAHLAGFRLLRYRDATGEHWDYSLNTLQTACRRWQRASESAVRLFEEHPGLQPHIPMLHDKTPIVWGRDSLRLMVRKVARAVAASPPVLWNMEWLVAQIEWMRPRSALLPLLYRWIAGSYMWRGYREGLRAQRAR